MLRHLNLLGTILLGTGVYLLVNRWRKREIVPEGSSSGREENEKRDSIEASEAGSDSEDTGYEEDPKILNEEIVSVSSESIIASEISAMDISEDDVTPSCPSFDDEVDSSRSTDEDESLISDEDFLSDQSDSSSDKFYSCHSDLEEINDY